MFPPVTAFCIFSYLEFPIPTLSFWRRVSPYLHRSSWVEKQATADTPARWRPRVGSTCSCSSSAPLFWWLLSLLTRDGKPPSLVQLSLLNRNREISYREFHFKNTSKFTCSGGGGAVAQASIIEYLLAITLAFLLDNDRNSKGSSPIVK
jgi:hypothetical protein